jgi:hypothetical protein
MLDSLVQTIIAVDDVDRPSGQKDDPEEHHRLALYSATIRRELESVVLADSMDPTTLIKEREGGKNESIKLL